MRSIPAICSIRSTSWSACFARIPALVAVATIASIMVVAESCVIILRPEEKPKPIPIPIPIPLACSGVPSDVPRAHILFDVRIDRGAANLREHYRDWMLNVAQAVATAGIYVETAALTRLDERPVSTDLLAAWGCTLSDPREVDPADVILHYALRANELPASPIGCAVDPLARVGARLPDVVTQYPSEISAGKSGLRVFGEAPDLVLIVHIDHIERGSGLDEPACANAQRLLSVDASGAASWLSYSSGSVPSSRVVHWFIATEEGIDRATLLDRCRRLDGFPADVLDHISESQRLLYTPLEARLIDAGYDHAAGLPLCKMLVDNEAAAFLKQQIETIASTLGTVLNEEALERVLSGGGLPTDDLPPLETLVRPEG